MIGLMKFIFFTHRLTKKPFLLKSLVLPIGSGDIDTKSEVSDFYGVKHDLGIYLGIDDCTLCDVNMRVLWAALFGTGAKHKH
jgi:hypothetical protein